MRRFRHRKQYNTKYGDIDKTKNENSHEKQYNTKYGDIDKTKITQEKQYNLDLNWTHYGQTKQLSIMLLYLYQ